MLTYAEEYIKKKKKKKKTNYLVGVLLIKCFKKKNCLPQRNCVSDSIIMDGWPDT